MNNKLMQEIDSEVLDFLNPDEDPMDLPNFSQGLRVTISEDQVKSSIARLVRTRKLSLDNLGRYFKKSGNLGKIQEQIRFCLEKENINSVEAISEKLDLPKYRIRTCLRLMVCSGIVQLSSDFKWGH